MTLVTTSRTYAQKDTAFPSQICLVLDPEFHCLLRQAPITLRGLNSLLIYMEMGGLKDIVRRLQCQISNQIIKIKKQFDKPNFPAENTVLLIAVISVSDF